jgi:drug/metabolite transporter (DMT)-like permease
MTVTVTSDVEPDNLRGGLWILLSALCFVAMTTMVRFLSSIYSAEVQTFYRQLAGLIVLWPIVVFRGWSVLAARRWGLMLFRSAAQSLGFILTFYSFQVLPLADANAFSFTRALWVVPLAVLFLGERLGLPQLVLTVIGFGGVLVMLDPGGFAFGKGQVTALIAALLIAATNISVKSLSRDQSIFTLVIWSSFLGAALTAPFAIVQAHVPSGPDLLLLLLMGTLGVAAQMCNVRGLQIGAASVVVPIDYTRLIFATVIGSILFGEYPSVATILGAAFIIGATVLLGIIEYRKRGVGPVGDVE